MNSLHHIQKLSLNLFLSILFRFEMRASLPGVGGDLALRRIESWSIDSSKTWFVSTRQMDIISYSSRITLYFKQNNNCHVL